jgi:uncharacterized membrane protein YeaQ/YmgE (transglycosylase-associated protein family)
MYVDWSLMLVAIACFVGAVVGDIIKWLGSDGQTTKQLLQSIVTGIITAVVFAGAYQLLDKTVTIYDLFAALVAGAGTVLGQSQIQLSGTLRRMGKSFREF